MIRSALAQRWLVVKWLSYHHNQAIMTMQYAMVGWQARTAHL